MDLFLEKYSNNTGLTDCADNSDANKGNCIFNLDILDECAQPNYGFMPVNGNVRYLP